MDLALLEREALNLPEADRAVLADHLLSSLGRTPGEIRDKWVIEVKERMAAYESGRMEAVDGERALDSLRAKLR